MTTKTENTENNYFTENALPTKQQLRDLNTATRSGIGDQMVIPATDGADAEIDQLPMAQTDSRSGEKCAYLKEFMLPERYESLTRRLDFRTQYMIMCLEDIYYPHNASAVIRSSEAFGLQEMHAVEHTVRFAPNKHIVRGTDQWLDIRKWKETPALVSHLRERGYRIVVTAPPRPNSPGNGHTPSDFDLAAGPFALFMGTEKSGISEWLMNEADDTIYIPMVGFAESLNISVSAAIVAQRLTERLRDPASGINWQLDQENRDRLMYQWLKSSVRDADRILEHGGFGRGHL